jgi:Flp pilus assembly protein protease CpaA
MTTLLLLDIIRLAPVTAILAIAAYRDYKHGEVTNKLWLYTPAGLAFSIVTYLWIWPQLLGYAAASAIISITASIAMFCIGGWGGADSKALIMVGLCTPLSPTGNLLPLTLLWASSIIALVYALAARKKHIRFLPAFFAGFIVACIL